MPPKKQTQETEPAPDGGNVAWSEIQGAIEAHEPPEIAALVLGGIITHSDGLVTWREGHLEHVANLYKGDPVTTERNYADDLAVVRRYSADVWEQLTNG